LGYGGTEERRENASAHGFVVIVNLVQGERRSVLHVDDEVSHVVEERGND
jgi:hypothetical protein